MAASDHRSAEAQKVLDNIDALLPDFAQRTGYRGCAPRVDESAQQLQEAGFFKLLQPEQWNGYQCDPVSFYGRSAGSPRHAVPPVGSPASSAYANWHLALFDQQAQEEVWGKDTDVRISSSYAPMGIGEVVDGGYKVNGNWAFSSGCDLADWTFVGGPVIRTAAPSTSSATSCRARTTPSGRVERRRPQGHRPNTLEVRDVFVPRHRVLSMRTMGMGESPAWSATPRRSTRCRGAPSTRAPSRRPSSAWPTAPTTPTSSTRASACARLRRREEQGRPFAKVRIAQAASEIDAAWRQLSGNLQAEYDLIPPAREVPMELRLAARRDQVRATGRAIEAIDMLFENSGAGALNVDSPIQRFWRDAHGGRVHAANDPERAYVAFGNGEFGIPSATPWSGSRYSPAEERIQ